MKCALNLAENGRILSVTYEKYAPDGVIVAELSKAKGAITEEQTIEILNSQKKRNNNL